jgi:hypothetical protein
MNHYRVRDMDAAISVPAVCVNDGNNRAAGTINVGCEESLLVPIRQAARSAPARNMLKRKFLRCFLLFPANWMSPDVRLCNKRGQQMNLYLPPLQNHDHAEN